MDPFVGPISDARPLDCIDRVIAFADRVLVPAERIDDWMAPPPPTARSV